MVAPCTPGFTPKRWKHQSFGCLASPAPWNWLSCQVEPQSVLFPAMLGVGTRHRHPSHVRGSTLLNWALFPSELHQLRNVPG
ncbi:hypothetical protein DL93DRAFT_2089858, partial [Clavulina sp. PMI_390]